MALWLTAQPHTSGHLLVYETVALSGNVRTL